MRNEIKPLPRFTVLIFEKMASETALVCGDITVLVCIGERRRPVRSNSSSLEALKAAVLSQFSDILPASNFSPLFQMKDENWGGMFVDIVEGQFLIGVL